jgi:hypothetical protein
MRKFPKQPFKAICVKEFNTKPNEEGNFTAWGCLELLRIYEFKVPYKGNRRFQIVVKDISCLSGHKIGENEPGFNIAKTKSDSNQSVPYFWDHFVIL